MATRAQKVKLGLFLVAALVLLALMLGLFAGLRLWSDRVNYYVRFEQTVGGLQAGAPVTMRGVRVGSVTRIHPPKHTYGSVKVQLGVEPNVSINSAAKAYLRFQGLTGVKTVDISGGHPRAPPLAPGGTIESGETALEVAQQQVDELADRALSLMDKLDSVATDLDALVSAVEPAQVQQSLEQATELVTNLNAASTNLRALTSETRNNVSLTLGDVRAAVATAQDAFADAAALVESAGPLVRTLREVVGSNEDQVRATLYNLQQATESLKRLARKLRERPSELLYSQPPKERELR